MSNYNSLLLTSKDRDKWNELVENSDIKDVYHTWEYCSIYEKDYHNVAINNNLCGDACLFFHGNDQEYIIFPFLKRNLIKLGFYENLKSKFGEVFDVVSPYGYSGPIGKNIHFELLKSFLAALNQFYIKEKIVTEFVRLHPLLKNHEFMQEHLEVTKRNKIVYLDFSPNYSQIISDMNKKTRNSIRKSEKCNLILKRSESIEDLKEFTNLYLNRMEEKNTHAYYFLPLDFFKETKEKLKENLFLLTVKLNDRMIAGALFMQKFGFLHYHFSGSDSNYKNLNPTNLILTNAIKIGKENNLQNFLLGGGTSSSEQDQLLKFKKGFSESTADFYTYSRIIIPNLYKAICEYKANYDLNKGLVLDNLNYFPQYRG